MNYPRTRYSLKIAARWETPGKGGSDREDNELFGQGQGYVWQEMVDCPHGVTSRTSVTSDVDVLMPHLYRLFSVWLKRDNSSNQSTFLHPNHRALVSFASTTTIEGSGGDPFQVSQRSTSSVGLEPSSLHHSPRASEAIQQCLSSVRL